MLNNPSIPTEKPNIDWASIRIAELFIGKHQDISKLNGNRNKITREAVTILCNLEDFIRESGKKLSKDDLFRIMQVAGEFEPMQEFNADITHHLLNLASLVQVNQSRIKEGELLDRAKEGLNPKELSIAVSNFKFRIDSHGFDDDVAIGLSNLLTLVKNYTDNNDVTQLNGNQKNEMTAVLVFIQELISMREFHQLAASEVGTEMGLEEVIFRIKMDLVLSGGWNYCMNA